MKFNPKPVTKRREAEVASSKPVIGKPKPEPRPRKTPKPIKVKAEKVRTLPESNRQALEHQLDVLASKYVIARDGKCITCGTRDGLTCSHYIDRRYMFVRWDEANIACQCANCNGKHDSFKEPYRNWIEKNLGKWTVEWLEAEGKHVHKWSEWELLEKIAYFKAAIKDVSRE